MCELKLIIGHIDIVAGGLLRGRRGDAFRFEGT
jgi:hypothetical protein